MTWRRPILLEGYAVARVPTSATERGATHLYIVDHSTPNADAFWNQLRRQPPGWRAAWLLGVGEDGRVIGIGDVIGVLWA